MICGLYDFSGQNNFFEILAPHCSTWQAVTEFFQHMSFIWKNWHAPEVVPWKKSHGVYFCAELKKSHSSWLSIRKQPFRTTTYLRMKTKKQNPMYSSSAHHKNETLKFFNPNMNLRFDWNCVTQCWCSWRVNLSDLCPSLLVCIWEFYIMNKTHVTGLDGTISRKRALQILFYEGETSFADFATRLHERPWVHASGCFTALGELGCQTLAAPTKPQNLPKHEKIDDNSNEYIDWIDAWNIMFCDREPCFI